MAHGGPTLPTAVAVVAAPPAPTAWHVDQELAPCPDAPSLGRTVAMNGSWLFTSSWHDHDLGLTPPVVHAFRLSGRSWACDAPVQHPALDPHADFGRAIAIHGNLLAIGAPQETVQGMHAAGAVHLFQWRGDGWRHISTIYAPVLQGGAEFGSSVALHGSRLIVGCPRWDHGSASFDEGRADLYSITESGLEHRGALHSPTPVQGGRFGFSVAISQTMMAVGAPWEPGISATTRGGAVHLGLIAAATGSSTWVTDRLGSHAASEWLGWSIALTDQDLVVGVPRADGGALAPSMIGRRRGCVATAQFTSNGVIVDEQRVWGLAYPEEHVGLSVAISCDWIIAGAPTASDAQSLQGATYLIKRTATGTDGNGQPRRWRAMQRIVAPNPVDGEGIGATVAICGPWAAAARTGDPEQPVTAGSALVLSLDWIQPFDDLAPTLSTFARDEGILHGSSVGVMSCELDPELSHVPTRGPIPVDDAGQSVVLKKDIALLGHSGLRRLASCHHVSSLPKDPWIANASACHTHARHATLIEHREDVFHSPNVTTAEDHAVWPPADQILQKLPAPRSLVALLHGPAMHGGPRVSQLVHSIEHTPESPLGIGRIIPTPSQFHGARHSTAYGIDHSAQDRNGFVIMMQKVPTTGSTLDLLDWARHVHIDHVVAHAHQNVGALSHLMWRGPHDLAGNRMVIGACGDVVFDLAHAALGGDQIGVFLAPPLAAVDEGAVKQRLGHTEWAAVAPRDQSHSTIAVPSKSSLKERGIKAWHECRHSWVGLGQARGLSDGSRKPPGRQV